MLETLRLVVAILLAVMFVGMGILHFVPSVARGMSAIIPPAIKERVSGKTLVRFTGLCEIAGGIGLLVPVLRPWAAIALIVFLIAVFPANAYAARHPERFGRAAIPFWPRLLAQLALIALLVFVAL
ncbi:putative membrane protein [Leifsonia sp. AK011]|uniref:DoxX family protein n=1 Tax=Leifsonia sp. AK011 TaxID=2723075 RepID=UPI0015C9B11A|nr:DoxX family protein [Leifsonia sp. AK011]NYF11374.1 putative membrane protein [Leifsonia sp. AK011]